MMRGPKMRYTGRDVSAKYGGAMDMSNGNDLGKIFADKKISGRCELCGSGDWKMSSDMEYLAFMKATEESTLESLTQVPVVALICGHCGNLRLFARNVLLS